MILKWVLPRPADVMAKLWFFVYGMLAALVFDGVADVPLHQLNTWFHPFLLWSQQNVPVWAMSIFLFTGFIVEECLLQQAKLLWDDIRDRERDKRLLHNRNRPVATGAISGRQAISNVLVRLLVVVLFLLWQARGDLLIIVSGILFHQAVYQWAKPKGSHHPLRLLLWLSWNNTLRFVAGFVWIGGLRVTFAFLLIGVVFYFCSVGGLAAQWKMEAEEVGDIRPQSAWYRKQGVQWQHVGLLTSILAAGVLCLFYGLWPSAMQMIWPPLPRFLPLEMAAFLQGGIAILEAGGGIAVFLVAGLFLVHLLQATRRAPPFFRAIQIRKQSALSLGGAVLILLSSLELVSLICTRLRPYTPFSLVCMLLIVTIMYLFLYEGMRYTAFAQVGKRSFSKKR